MGDSMLFEATFQEFNGIEMEIPLFSWTLEGVCVEEEDMGGYIVSFVPLDGQKCGEAGKYGFMTAWILEPENEIFGMSGLNALELFTIMDSSGNKFAECTLEVSLS